MYKINLDHKLKYRLEKCLTYIQISKKVGERYSISPAIKSLIPLLKFHIVSYETSFTDCLSNIFISDEHMKLPAKQLTFIICHEICHILFLHSLRAKSFDIYEFDIWNRATDYYINSLLETYSALEVPKLFDKDGVELKICLDHKYSHLNTGEEDIYKKIYKDSKNKKNQAFKNFFDTHKHWSNNSSTEDKLKENAIIQVINNLKRDFQQNCMNGGDAIINRIHDMYISKENNWEKRLRYYLVKTFSSEVKYNYHRNSRNNLTKYFIPARMKAKKPTPKFLFAVDTSGSINDKQLALFKGEIYRILKAGAYVDIVACHQKIHQEIICANINDIVNFMPNETGGTNFNPVFNFATKSKVKYDFIIYLTDGFGCLDYYNHTKFKNNTIWLINGENGENFVLERFPNFGKVINIK